MGFGRKSLGMIKAYALAAVNMYEGAELHLFDNSATAPVDASQAESGLLIAIITRDGAEHTQGQTLNGLMFEPKTGTESTFKKLDSHNWRGVWLVDGKTPSHFRLYDKNVTTGQSPNAIRLDGDIGGVGSGAALELDVAVTTLNREVVIETFELPCS